MKVWGLVSQKGGAGKSTLCTQLAVHAQLTGERVAIADLDPQASAYGWGQLRGEREPTVIRALPNRLPKVIEAAAEMGMTMVMIDTAPRTDDGALAAIRVSDLIICPTKPMPFEVMAMRDTVALLDLSDRKQRALAVINCITPSTPKLQAAEYDAAVADIAEYGLRICAGYVCNRRAMINAISKGAGVTESKNKDDKKASDEIKALWDELLLLQMPSGVVTKLRSA